VKRAVLVDALVVGVVASGAGLVAGIGVAAGLQQLMSALGFDMPDGPTVIQPSALITSLAVGVIVTVLSAWLPARRAARIAPLAALREVSVDRSAGSVRRAVAGSVVTAGGVAALLAGVGGEVALVGLGAVVTFGGVVLLAPVLARPIARLFGVPLRLRGLSGELATRNATRNSRRTARTASSLMIGVALVGFMTVFAASAKSSLAGSLETEFTGTHIVQGGGWDNSSGLSPSLADELRVTPGVDVVTQARLTPAIVDGSTTEALRLRRHHRRRRLPARHRRGRPPVARRRRHRRVRRRGRRAGLDDRLARAGDVPRRRHDVHRRGDLLQRHRLGRTDVRRPRRPPGERRRRARLPRLRRR
jgi:putative ABC transport system permease protein